MNTDPKNHYLYSDKFRVSVVDLKQLEKATHEDKKYMLDLWAKLFTTTTWEEVEVLAQNNEYLQETVSGVRQLTEDEKIRQQCQAREDFYYWERLRNIEREKDKETILQQAETIQALSSENTLLIHLITSKLKAGKSLEQIATEVEMSAEEIRPLYERITQDLSAD